MLLFISYNSNTTPECQFFGTFLKYLKQSCRADFLSTNKMLDVDWVSWCIRAYTKSDHNMHSHKKKMSIHTKDECCSDGISISDITISISMVDHLLVLQHLKTDLMFYIIFSIYLLYSLCYMLLVDHSRIIIYKND